MPIANSIKDELQHAHLMTIEMMSHAIYKDVTRLSNCNQVIASQNTVQNGTNTGTSALHMA